MTPTVGVSFSTAALLLLGLSAAASGDAWWALIAGLGAGSGVGLLAWAWFERRQARG